MMEKIWLILKKLQMKSLKLKLKSLELLSERDFLHLLYQGWFHWQTSFQVYLDLCRKIIPIPFAFASHINKNPLISRKFQAFFMFTFSGIVGKTEFDGRSCPGTVTRFQGRRTFPKARGAGGAKHPQYSKFRGFISFLCDNF